MSLLIYTAGVFMFGFFTARLFGWREIEKYLAECEKLRDDWKRKNGGTP